MKNKPYYEVRKINDIRDLVNSSCELYAERNAYLYKKDGKYTPILFKQVKKNMDELGTALIELGLKDKRIAVIGENRYEWAISYLAVINGVGVVVPLDKQLPENEILNCLHRSEAKCIIYSSKLKEKIDSIKSQTDASILIDMDIEEDEDGVYSLKKLLERGRELLDQGNKEYLNAEIDSHKMAELLFTSGTTSESKAVMLSHRNICFNIENQCKMLEIVPEDIFLSVLPIHHAYECTCGFLTPLYRGACVAYCEGLRHIAENMKEAHVSVILSVPVMFEMIYGKLWEGIRKQGKEKLVKRMIKITNFLDKLHIHIKRKVFKQIHDQLGGNVKVLIAGAAAINPEVAQGFRDLGILAVQGYGLSECAPIAALNRDVDYKDDAAGLPLVNTEIKIVDPNDEGVGEIATKGEHVMLGYYKNEEATKETIQDGWLHTGDLGYIDSDGFVHVTGRKKNVIITKNGKNVYPEEIEKLLSDSPFIKESLVYGKRNGDNITITAQILLDKDYIEQTYGKSITDEKIKKLVWEDVKRINQKLVIYKHIKAIEIREKEFEKTTTLKIKRYKENV